MIDHKTITPGYYWAVKDCINREPPIIVEVVETGWVSSALAVYETGDECFNNLSAYRFLAKVEDYIGDW